MKKYSMDEAASKFFSWTGKYKGRKLRRKIASVEAKTGRVIMTKTREPNNAAKYWVTEESLRSELPELFKTVTVDAVKELSLVIDGIRMRIDSIVESRIDSKLQRHGSDDCGRLSREIAAIGQRLQLLERRLDSLSPVKR